MSSKDSRKNFPIKIVEEVFSEQGGLCGKCGKSLMYGYHVHHKDGDNTNIAKENCQLLCKACHGAKQYETLQLQKQAIITDLDALIKKGVEGGLAGATIERLLDAIKLKLSLQGQIYDDPSIEPPIETRMKDYQIVMEHGLREYEKGVKEGLGKGIDLWKPDFSTTMSIKTGEHIKEKEKVSLSKKGWCYCKEHNVDYPCANGCPKCDDDNDPYKPDKDSEALIIEKKKKDR